ncbi:uncharacterized protein LOC113279209 [Papaver somniferum]|uniref:uncharacterized protein LOC113279209 n=1 Tax=Papaver somniferum TaxID=3469 RepID=UPI000E701FE3|nr:uncharacterized protein LOC113279209 [Papaver somniferum]
MRKMQEHFIALEEIQEESRDRGVQEACVVPESTSDDIQRLPEKRPSPRTRGNGKKEWVAKGKRPSFDGTVTIPKSEVTLRVSDGGGYLDTLTTFCVVDVASPYEVIIGRPWIAGIKGVASAYHQRLRFPTYKGIAEVVGDPQASRQFMQVDAQINEERRARQRGEKKRAKESKVAEELERVISQAVMTYEAQGNEPS